MNRKPFVLTGESNKELENLFSTTINSLSVWFQMVDRDLKIIMMNDSLKGMMKSLGFREYLYKSKLKEVFPFLTKKAINEYHKVIKTGKSIVSEEMYEFEGRKIYTETIKEPVFEGNKVVRVITVIRDISNRKQTEVEILESQKQMKIFATHLQDVREEERVVIARELHDNLGQNLTAIRIGISQLIKKLNKSDQKPDIPSLKALAAELIPMIDATLHMAQKISSELRPPVLEELGLVPAMEWQIGEFIKRTGMSCTFQSDLQKIEIDAQNSIAVVRIFQEALTNIIRHAHATLVNVCFRKKPHSIILEVKDNGSGIKESNITDAHALGLLGMRERAILMGGTLMIKGKAGKGTVVRLSIPIKM